MMRVAKRGNVILPVNVIENSPKIQRQEGFKQYMAHTTPIDFFATLIGHGDTIEEAVDELSAQL